MPSTPLHPAAIEESAARARRRIAPSIDVIDPMPVESMVARLEHELLAWSVVSAVLPASIWASTHVVGERELVTRLCKVAWRELRENVPRTRFSIAHELGHVHLHGRDLLALSYLPQTTDDALDRPQGVIPVREREASRWAGALLVPAEGLRALNEQGALTVEEVARRYQVSPLVAERRIGEVMSTVCGPAHEVRTP